MRLGKMGFIMEALGMIREPIRHSWALRSDTLLWIMCGPEGLSRQGIRIWKGEK